MCERGLTGDGDEESDGGLCCSSSVERNAAVMSRLQEGACLLMTQSPDLHAPPISQPQSSLNPLNLFTASNSTTFHLTHHHHIMCLYFSVSGSADRELHEWREMNGKQQEETQDKGKTAECSQLHLMLFF